MKNIWTKKWMLQPVRNCKKGCIIAPVAPAKGTTTMKITKKQLKQIVKEELQQIMETNGYDMPSQDPYPVSPETGGGIWFPLLRELGAEDPTNPNEEIGGLAVRIVDIFEKYGWEHPTETRPEAGAERGQREFERG